MQALIACAAVAAAPAAKTFEIAPGVHMPAILLGTGYMPPADCTPQPACLPAWQEATAKVMTSAWLAAGARGIDTANIYNTQAGIAAAIAESGVARKDIFILTKIPGVSNYSTATHLLEENVKQLGGQPLDVVISHWCSPNSQHPPMPGFECTKEHTIETWRALEDFYKAGKARAIGVSNYCKKDFENLLSNATVVPHLHQVERSPYYAQREMVEYCAQKGIHLQSYAPVNDADHQSGTGPAAQALLKDPVVAGIAQDMKISPGQVVLQWQVQGGHSATPRVGGQNATKPNLDHMRQNIAVGDGSVPALSHAAMEQLNSIGDKPKAWPTVGAC